MKPITLEITILAPMSKVWELYNDPEHITKWHYSTDEWSCTSAENELVSGGHFKYHMEAKDQSFGYDYQGVYEEVMDKSKIIYRLDDGRQVWLSFDSIDANTTKVTKIFEPDPREPEQMQRDAWYEILDRFHKYVENY